MSEPPNSGNAKPPTPRNSSSALEQLWQKTQPVLNRTAARSLRSIIWLLEQALVKVEPNAPEAPRIAAEKTPALFRQISRAWAWLLKTIRSLLPRSQREKLSDTALSGIILGTVLLGLWVNSALKPTPAPASIVAARPAIEQPAPVAIPDTLPAPADPTLAIEPVPEGGEAIEPAIEPAEPEAIEPAPVAEVPAVEPVPEIREPEVTEPEPEVIKPEPEVIEPEAEAEAIEELPNEPEAEVAEPLPEISAEETPEGGKAIEPAPPLLTPEQTLVAAIQDQVGNLTNQYGNGLIQNIQANFRSGRLTVKINDSWYELSETKQNQLAAEMLDRARSLDFRRLEITDLQGTLIARSPIVGTEMIILQRSIQP